MTSIFFCMKVRAEFNGLLYVAHENPSMKMHFTAEAF